MKKTTIFHYILIALAFGVLGVAMLTRPGSPAAQQPAPTPTLTQGRIIVATYLRAEAFDDDRAMPTCAVTEPGFTVEIEGLRETEGGKFLLVNVLHPRRDTLIMPPTGICRGWLRYDYVRR